MRCFGTRRGRRGRNQDTYNDILSRLEGADVVGVMRVVHLLQDGRHAGEIVALQHRMSHMTSLCPTTPTPHAPCSFYSKKDTTICAADGSTVDIERGCCECGRHGHASAVTPQCVLR